MRSARSEARMNSCPTTVAERTPMKAAAARERAAGPCPAHPFGFVHQHEEVAVHERIVVMSNAGTRMDLSTRKSG